MVVAVAPKAATVAIDFETEGFGTAMHFATGPLARVWIMWDHCGLDSEVRAVFEMSKMAAKERDRYEHGGTCTLHFGND
jgi:hypothetical protein